MLVKLVTLRFDPRLGGFDDRPLAAVLRSHEVVSVSEHFFVHDEVPYWAFAVTCRMPEADGEPTQVRAPDEAKGRSAYREILRAEDWPLFNALRDWRSDTAAKEGVPPYIVVPNDVLARIARERPRTLNALGQIHGMGAARVKRHGRALLAALGVAAPPPGEAEEDRAPGEAQPEAEPASTVGEGAGGSGDAAP